MCLFIKVEYFVAAAASLVTKETLAALYIHFRHKVRAIVLATRSLQQLKEIDNERKGRAVSN